MHDVVDLQREFKVRWFADDAPKVYDLDTPYCEQSALAPVFPRS